MSAALLARWDLTHRTTRLSTGLLGTGVAIFGFIALGFLADAIGRKPTAMLYYAMCLVLTPVVYRWTHSMGGLLAAVTVFGFFTGGIWAWAPVWLPELFPTRMRGTAVAFCFNAPRWISCIGPLIAGTLIVSLGGYSSADRSTLHRCLEMLADGAKRKNLGNSARVKFGRSQ
jgi:MFS family permease